ncbi:hypothetical protein BDY24DRAFT_440955 [Mrakia frigida]|uniref:O-fucosyltransferase family protein n=1 Tax=Mrakia frigida TaxID=29902 RepID=UPI003FCC25D8
MGSPTHQQPRFLRIALPLTLIISIALFFYWPDVHGAWRLYEPTREGEGGGGELVTSADDSLLTGNPGDATMDRLQPHLSYLTAGKGAGLTNQVWSAINLLYLSYLTNRVAILPPFFANQQILSTTRISGLPVSGMFNLSRLQLEVPLLRGVLDWEDVHPGSEAEWVTDSKDWPEIGGWGGLQKNVKFGFAKLKPIWTPYPGTTRSTTDPRYLNWVGFVPYLTPNSAFYQSFIARLLKSTPDALPPNDHLVCIDEVLAGSEMTGGDPYSEFVQGLGGWKYIGTHMHFRDELVEQGRVVLRKVFGVGEEEEVPPFIAVHIRHGDFFKEHCPKDAGDRICYTVSQYAYGVARLQDEMVAAGVPSTTNVLVLTDELDDTFFEEVKRRGWKTSRDGQGVDDSVLRNRLGGWYPTILDKVLMSLGSHFVGTDRSTMSVLSSRRVQDWNNGLAHMTGPTGPSLSLEGETLSWS